MHQIVSHAQFVRAWDQERQWPHKLLRSAPASGERGSACAPRWPFLTWGADGAVRLAVLKCRGIDSPMMTFREYIQAVSHGVFAPVKPFSPKRATSTMPSCRERARRMIRKFEPRIVQDVPQVRTAVQRREPMTWGPVR